MPLKLAMCSCRWTVLSPRHNSFRAPQKRARPTSSSFPLPKHLTDGPEPRGLSRAATPAHMRGEMKNMGCGRSTLWAPTQRGLGGPYGTNCEREILLPGALYAHCPSSGTRSGALGLCTTTRNHSYLFFSFPPPSLSVRAAGCQWEANIARRGSSSWKWQRLARTSTVPKVRSLGRRVGGAAAHGVGRGGSSPPPSLS
jgi:hypothetical protein